MTASFVLHNLNTGILQAALVRNLGCHESLSPRYIPNYFAMNILKQGKAGQAVLALFLARRPQIAKNYWQVQVMV